MILLLESLHPDAEVLLGDIALRRNDAAGAEQRFRTALARRPNFQPAMEGLERSLRQQGRSTRTCLAWGQPVDVRLVVRQRPDVPARHERR